MPEGLDAVTVDLEGPDGSLRVEWDPDALVSLSPRDGAESAVQPWRLASEGPDWKRWSSLRVLSAAFEDGAMLAAAALRPRKAKGHDADLRRAVLVREGTPMAFDEFLLSEQFDGTGRLTRVNVEAYLDADSVPIRVSGDVASTTGEVLGEDAMDVNTLEMRMNGHSGFATVDVLRPA